MMVVASTRTTPTDPSQLVVVMNIASTLSYIQYDNDGDDHHHNNDTDNSNNNKINNIIMMMMINK